MVRIGPWSNDLGDAKVNWEWLDGRRGQAKEAVRRFDNPLGSDQPPKDRSQAIFEANQRVTGQGAR